MTVVVHVVLVVAFVVVDLVVVLVVVVVVVVVVAVVAVVIVVVLVVVETVALRNVRVPLAKPAFCPPPSAPDPDPSAHFLHASTRENPCPLVYQSLHRGVIESVRNQGQDGEHDDGLRTRLTLRRRATSG